MAHFPPRCPKCWYHHGPDAPCLTSDEIAERRNPAPPTTLGTGLAGPDTTTSKTEFSVREVKRFIVTRYDTSADGKTGKSTEKGEYGNRDVAHEVAYALAREEANMLGLSPGDARVQYPKQFGDITQLKLPGVLGNEYTDLELVQLVERVGADRIMTSYDIVVVNRFIAHLREFKRGQAPDGEQAQA